MKKLFFSALAILLCVACYLVGERSGLSKLKPSSSSRSEVVSTGHVAPPDVPISPKELPTAAPNRDRVFALPRSSLDKLNLRLFDPDFKLTAEFREAASLTSEQAEKMNSLIGQALSAINSTRENSAVVTENSETVGGVSVEITNAAVLQELEKLRDRISSEISQPASELFAVQLNRLLQRNNSSFYRAARYEIKKDGGNAVQTTYTVKMDVTPMIASGPMFVSAVHLTREQVLLKVPLAGNLLIVEN